MHMLSEKEMLADLLMFEKHCALLCVETAEHTNDRATLHTLMQCAEACQEARLEIFQAMNSRGWYNPQWIDQSQLNQTRQKLRQAQNEPFRPSHMAQSSGYQTSFQTQYPSSYPPSYPGTFATSGNGDGSLHGTATTSGTGMGSGSAMSGGSAGPSSQGQYEPRQFGSQARS